MCTMQNYTFTDLTEFQEIPDKDPIFVTFKNCNFQKLNLESYKFYWCTFENCHIVEPLTIECHCLTIKNSDIKLSEHIKVELLSIQYSNFTIRQKIKVTKFVIKDSTIKDIHNVNYTSCKIYMEINEELLNMIINGDLIKDKHTCYELYVSYLFIYKIYNFIYNYLDYNITGYCGLVFFDTLRNEYRKIRLIKAVEALQNKFKFKTI